MELHEFMGLLDPPFTGEELFDHLTDTVFFIKNREGKYLSVNQTLVSRCGCPGKTGVGWSSCLGSLAAAHGQPLHRSGY